MKNYSSGNGTFAKATGYLTLFILMMAITSILSGIVMVELWGWFVTPEFKAIPALDLKYAIGIGLLVRYLTYQYPTGEAEKGKTTEKLLQGFICGVLLPVFALVGGFIVHLF